MRKRLAGLGVLLLLLALLTYLYPSTVSPLSASLGQTSVSTVLDKTNVISIQPEGSSSYFTNLSNGDSLAASMTTNPGNVDVLLMNQENFNLWNSSSRGSYSTYPQSALHVSNYSFTFTNSEQKQDFYVVLVSHSSAERTSVLLHVVVTRPSQVSLLLFPIIFGALGVVVLLVARGGGARRPSAPSGRMQSQSQKVQGSQGDFCRHCGVALSPGAQFCPSCNRSQS